jgi:ATP-binding protein involved in chromosome partitioning
MVSKEDVERALQGVRDPELGKDLVSLNMVQEVVVDGDRVSFTLNLTTPACPLRSRLETEAREAVGSIKGVRTVEMKTSAQVVATHVSGDAEPLKGVKNIIAVASGKGGVGKSTVAVNLALALAGSGAKVGILDADVYGPNIPLMMGTSKRPSVKGDRIEPLVAHGVEIASLGSFYSNETPLVWRGPMVAGAVKQLLTQVEWGELDYLICDLPPGSGDSGLTLAQTVPLGGVVIVTTPQDAALNIAIKAVGMFRKLKVPILGMVENMSYFVCPHCGERSEIFASGGGRRAADVLGVQFLGEIPLYPRIREQSDLGVPIVVADPSSPESLAFKDIAFRVAGMISMVAYTQEARPGRLDEVAQS